MFTEPFIYGRQDREFQNGLFAGRAEALFLQFKGAKTLQQEDAVLAAAASMDVAVESLPAEEQLTRKEISLPMKNSFRELKR